MTDDEIQTLLRQLGLRGPAAVAAAPVLRRWAKRWYDKGRRARRSAGFRSRKEMRLGRKRGRTDRNLGPRGRRCYYCGADIDQPCRTPSGKQFISRKGGNVRFYHQDRIGRCTLLALKRRREEVPK